MAMKFKKTDKQAILDMTAEHFQLPAKNLIGSEAVRHLFYPRAIAMRIMREELKISYSVIGKFFGGRDHSTVMHAVKKANELCDTDIDYLSAYGTIQNKFRKFKCVNGQGNLIYAYCYQDGEIFFDATLPEGALPIAYGPEEFIRSTIIVRARHAYQDDTYLVPGVPESDSEADKRFHLNQFFIWLHQSPVFNNERKQSA